MNATNTSLNLIEKYQDSDIQEKFNQFKSEIDGFSDSNENFDLKTGDVIKFIGGYDSNIEFTSQILGFNSKGFAFVLWDCYWVALNLHERLISKS